MARYYTYSINNYWDGDFVNTGPKNKPRRSTETQPPTLPPDQFAIYVKQSDSWNVTDIPEPLPVDTTNYRTVVSTKELIELIGEIGFSEIYRAGNAQGAFDSVALFFIISYLADQRELQIDLSTIETQLSHFLSEDFITQVDYDRILQGTAD